MRIRRWIVKRGDAPPSMSPLSAGGPQSGAAVELDGFDGLRLQLDPSPASWLRDTLWTGSGRGTVSRIVPPIFEAYARIDDFGNMAVNDEPYRTALAVLERFTSTPDEVWFALWEGYGCLDNPPPGLTKLDVPPEQPMRSYYLYRGRLAAAAETLEYPMGRLLDLAWPDDRAWFLGTDTDFPFSLIGASEQCIAALKRSGLNVRRLAADDRY